MSQYPSPYSPPPPPYLPPQPPIDFSYYAPQAELLAPARRAAILQAVLGGLVLACGVCLGAMPWVVDLNEMIAQSGMSLPEAPTGMSLIEMMRIAYTAAGVIGGLVGVGLLVLSYFVRGGGAVPAVLSIVLECLVVLVLLMNLVSALIQAASNPLVGLFAALIVLAMLAPFGLNIAWLAAVARGASRLREARQQYAAHYYQLQQQQHAYAQPGGYGTPYAPQPPPQQSYAPQPYGYSPPSQPTGNEPPPSPPAT